MPTYFADSVNGSDANDGLDHLGFNLSAASFNNGTFTLTKTGAFTAYTFTTGDRIYISGGTGVTVGLYTVLGKVDNDSIQLTQDIGGTNPTDVTSSSGPELTLGAAETDAATDDTIVAEGTFTEEMICNDKSLAILSLDYFRSGGDGRFIVDGQNTRSNCIRHDDTSQRVFILIGAELKNATSHGLHSNRLAGFNHGIYIENVWSHDNGGSGFGTSTANVNAMTRGFKAVNCRFNDNGGDGVNCQGNGLLLGCQLYNNVDAGVHAYEDAATIFIAVLCTLQNNGTNMKGAVHDILCTFDASDTLRNKLALVGQVHQVSLSYLSAFTNATTWGIEASDSNNADAIKARYCGFNANTSGKYTTGADSRNELLSPPQYINAAGEDLSLRAASAWVNRLVQLGLWDGSRQFNCEIGAHQRRAGAVLIEGR